MTKSVLRNFTKFTGKYLCQSLRHRCFPVNFAKFPRIPFSKNTSGRLLLNLRSISRIFVIKHLINHMPLRRIRGYLTGEKRRILANAFIDSHSLIMPL